MSVVPTTGRFSLRRAVSRRVLVTSLAIAALIALPFVLYPAMLLEADRRGSLSIDFRQDYRIGAERILDGVTPVDPVRIPPVVHVLAVPATFVPGVEWLLPVALICGLLASVWLLGVRDWRCFGAAAMWAPAFHAVQTANVTIWLLLAFALCWRFRQNVIGSGVAAGVATAVKAVAWPLGLWLLATRRYRSTAVAIAVAVAIGGTLTLGLGFAGMGPSGRSTPGYGDSYAVESYAPRTLFAELGAADWLAVTLTISLLALITFACLRCGRMGDEARALGWASVLAVVSAPHVWMHSLLFLLVPVALLRPRLSWPWLLPAVLWFGSGNGNGDPWQTVLFAAVGVVVAVGVLLPTFHLRVPARHGPAEEASRPETDRSF